MNTTLWTRLWRDERGFTASIELVLISTIAVLGMIVGLATYRDQITQELGDAATAVGAINQSYVLDYNPADPGSLNGTIAIDFDGGGDDFTATVFGSTYTDQPDFCETADAAGAAPACITIDGGPEQENGAIADDVNM